MIFFEKIRWRNFLSTGNTFTEVPLNQNKNALFVGENGSGKSTILDALVFVLFGKPYRSIRKPTLVNSVTTKDCLVEIDFSINGKAYKVRRGIKPVIFEIYCDGICLNQDSDSRDYQEYLEKNILRMSVKSFVQYVILGSASFTPFMQLNALDRRVVIENVLDIEIFSRMTGVVKSRMQENMQALDKNNTDLLAAEEKRVFIKRTLDKLRLNNEERVGGMQKQANEHETLLNNLRGALDELIKTRDALIASREDASKLMSKHRDMIKLQGRLEFNKEKAEKEIDFYNENDTCPTCKQSIEKHFKGERVQECKTSLTKLGEGIKELRVNVDALAARIAEQQNIVAEVARVKHEIISLGARIEELVAYINTTTTEIDRLRNSDNLIETSQQEFDDVEAEIKELEEIKKNLLSEKLYIETAHNLLKDGGIKSKIIRQYLPIINKMINHYLGLMGFFVKFNLNEQFEETIESRYRDTFSYENFSEGEKMRIDLAILFAWRDIARRKNSVDCNLLIMDEIFDSSLDANGTDDFIKIMWSLADNTNIFIISHKQDQLIDKFEKVYRFVKTKNFSKVAK